jgi:hypothetical protein
VKTLAKNTGQSIQSSHESRERRVVTGQMPHPGVADNTLAADLSIFPWCLAKKQNNQLRRQSK